MLCDSFFSYGPKTEICPLLRPSKIQPFNMRSCNLFAVIYLSSLDNQCKLFPSCISTVLSRTMTNTGPYADVFMLQGLNIRTWAGPLNIVYLPFNPEVTYLVVCYLNSSIIVINHFEKLFILFSAQRISTSYNTFLFLRIIFAEIEKKIK